MKTVSILTRLKLSQSLNMYVILLLMTSMGLLVFAFKLTGLLDFTPGSALLIGGSMLPGLAIFFLYIKHEKDSTAPGNNETGNLKDTQKENQDQGRIDFILNSLNDVFWSFDLTGKGKNYLSDSAERLYGRPVSELVNEPFFWIQYIHPEDIHLQETCHRTLCEEGTAECTYRIVGLNKIVRWIYSRNRAIRDKSGKIIRIEGVLTDVSYLKQAEEIIEKQELQINAVIDNLDMAILIVNKDGKILLINKQAQESNRRNNRLVHVGMNFFSLLSPDRRIARQEIFEKIFCSKSTINQVVDYPDKEGTVRYYSVYYIPVLGSNGDVEQICIMSRDITSQRLAEEKIREKTDLLRTIIHNLPDYVYVKDSELRHVINNKANLKLIGSESEEETFGKRTSIYFANESGEKSILDDQSIIDTGKPIINKEEEVIDNEGSRHWLLTTKVPLKNEQGKITGIVGISRDITDRKQMELSLRMSNERFEMAKRATDDAIWDWDLATNEAYLGENFKELFGYDWDTDRVNVSEWSKHIHPADLERVWKSLESIFESPVSNNKWQMEYRYICADGTVAHVCDRAFVILDETGKAVRMIGAMQNVTEVVEYRKSLEQKVSERTKELNLALEKQKEMVEAKSRFVSIASHEFRTPLSAIQFASGFLRKFHSKINSEDLERKLQGIEKQVVLMTALLDDILLIGKSEAGKLKINPVSIDVIEFLEKITSDIMNTKGTSHKIVKKSNVPTLTLVSDEKLLRNIFINLITNAIKFSPGKDSVNLDVELLRDCVCIRISDQGLGISESDLKTIFEPFQRGSNVNNIDGTGLGLSIVKKAVAALGGEVSVSSKESFGSEFTVTLPVS